MTGAQQTRDPAPVSNGSVPHVSPDGKHIAFVSNRTGNDDLFVISADGTGEMQLTHTPEDERLLGWTADGKQVLFSVSADGASRVYSVDLDEKNRRQIGNVAGIALAVSSDGKKRLLSRTTPLTVSALDGSDARQITDGSSVAWNPDWSPDGKRIAFTSRNDPKSLVAVFIINDDGLGRHQASHVPPEESGARGGAQCAVWSPDGWLLALQVNNLNSKTAHLWLVDVVTGEGRKLGAHDQPYVDETPSWFPDGKRIAFQSNRTGKMEVWVMNADGSGQRQVTRLKNDVEP